MNDRIEAELNLLRNTYPQLQSGQLQSGPHWVLIPRYVLPVNRFNMDVTPVLFSLPVGYPNTGPDNFFVDVNLRLRDGSNPLAFNPNPNSSTGPAPIPGNWGWFSWHPYGWRPSSEVAKGDNLLTYVKSVGICLRGEESA